MHITLETDYAIRIIQMLALSEKRVDAKTISEKTGVTLRFSLKILRKLVGAGYITSFKGTSGGYIMALTPKEISLCDVIETIEGPLNFSRCVEPGFLCTREKGGACQFQKVFIRLSEQIRKELQSVTFDQLI